MRVRQAAPHIGQIESQLGEFPERLDDDMQSSRIGSGLDACHVKQLQNGIPAHAREREGERLRGLRAELPVLAVVVRPPVIVAKEETGIDPVIWTKLVTGRTVVVTPPSRI